MEQEKKPEEIEAGLNRLLNRLKQDPQFELRQEFGKLLMIHIDDFTADQRKRYYELRKILSPQNP